MSIIRARGWKTAGRPAPTELPAPTEIVLSDIDALLLDKDGTLIDFHGMWSRWLETFVAALAAKYPAFQEAAPLFYELVGWDARDRRVRPGACLAMAPTRTGVTLAAGALHRTGVAWDEAWEGVMRTFEELEATFPWEELVTPVPGATRALQALHASGMGLAVVTADTTARARTDLARIGLASVIDIVVGADAAPAAKPDPAPALVACAQLGVLAARAAAVGDTTADCRMGRAARVGAVIAVLTGAGTLAELWPVADYVIDSVASLSAG